MIPKSIDAAEKRRLRKLPTPQQQAAITRRVAETRAVMSDIRKVRATPSIAPQTFSFLQPVITAKPEPISLRRRLPLIAKNIFPAKLKPNINYQRALSSRVPVLASVVALLIAFAAGVGVRIVTPQSAAVTIAQPPTPAGFTGFSLPLPPQPTSNITNDMLFNTPIGTLQSYLSAKPADDTTLATREAKIKQLLEDYNSPFVGEADLIAQQDHWKLILAISFAESTLGKHCKDNNCSGIGGSQIKTYSSLSSWITDFDQLLDSRYKDQTLQQMCGVYVQPCNPNWLSATKQVLDDITARDIE